MKDLRPTIFELAAEIIYLVLKGIGHFLLMTKEIIYYFGTLEFNGLATLIKLEISLK